ncbi:MAG: CPBP family intramembrane metalloprotease [Phycisphaerales bacterium]|nr:CPBP family intramembrane metalloprotease [Phycisphaerales bacterium]
MIASTGIVIASDGTASPAAGEDSPVNSIIWLIVWLAAALVSLGLLWRFRIVRPGSLKGRTPLARPYPVLAYLGIFVASFVFQTIAAMPALALARAWSDAPTDTTIVQTDPDAAVAATDEPPALTLRESVTMQLVSYAFTITMLAGCVLAFRNRFDADAPSPRARTRITVVVGVVGVGLLGLVAALPIVQIVGTTGSLIESAITHTPAPELSHESLTQMIDAWRDDRLWAWLQIAAVLIGAPVLEELTYRYGLQGAIIKLTGMPGLSIILTGILFGLAHASAVPASIIPSLMILGMGFGIVYERSRSLAAVIVMHAAFNLLNIVGTFLLT